jgi:hypothetical protein
MGRRIRLSADYRSWPLWSEEPSEVGEIDPHTLPVSRETIARLERWAETFDRWMNFDDPSSSAEPSAEEVEWFEAEGLELWRRLRRELGPDYEVTYYSKARQRVLSDESQLAS